MAELLRALSIPYIALTPGASYRGLHDSLVNYLGNTQPELLLCVHEESAVALAHGYARVTGRPGVCAVTAGPGVTDVVTAVANAQRGGIPMVVIGGAGPRVLADMGSLQDMNHVELMRPITKWSVSVPSTDRLQE